MKLNNFINNCTGDWLCKSPVVEKAVRDTVDNDFDQVIRAQGLILAAEKLLDNVSYFDTTKLRKALWCADAAAQSLIDKWEAEDF